MKKLLCLFVLSAILLTSCATGGEGNGDQGTTTVNNTEASDTTSTSEPTETTTNDDTTEMQTSTESTTTTEAVTTAAETTTEPAVKYENTSLKPDGFDNLVFHGRTIRDDKGANIEWTYSGFTLCGYFDGSVKMKYEGKTGYMKTIYLLITIDGQRQEELVALSATSGTAILATVKKGYHEITVRKGAEITAARFVLKELTFKGQIEKAKVDDKALKLEFIGDSITNGVGAVITETQEYRYPLGSNSLASYAGILSEKLGAESNLIAMSGYGISKGATNATDILPPLYEYVSPFAGENVKYDFGSFKPDAVILELGTNDHGTTETKFKDAAKPFVELIRSKYPNTPIIWIYGFGGYNFKEAIDEVIKSTSDKNIYYLEVKTDKTGRANHPCEESQMEYADQLEAKLREILKF